jgi:hypothetical protein
MPKAPTNKRIIREAMVQILQSETVKPYLKLKACNVLLKLMDSASRRKSQNAKSESRKPHSVAEKSQHRLDEILGRVQ